MPESALARVNRIAKNRERRRAEEARKQRQRWEAEAPQRRERNRQVQAAYRKRHAEDLIKARRVATALLSLRRDREPLNTTWHVAKALRAFLTPEELADLSEELKRDLPK